VITSNSSSLRLGIGIILTALAPLAAALPPNAGLNSNGTAIATDATAITTFQSIGLYWTPHAIGSTTLVVPAGNAVKIRYAKLTDSAWKDGHDMWFDNRALGGRPQEARGSIVELDPNTQYIVQLGLPPTTTGGNVTWVAEVRPTTWPDPFPTVNAPANQTWSNTRTMADSTTSTYPGSTTQRRHILHVTQSGNASGYVLYDFTGKNAVGNVQQFNPSNGRTFNNPNDFCAVISADFVIIRGLKCVGGGLASIWIDPGHHDIVIEDSDISGFNRPRGDLTTENCDLFSDAAANVCNSPGTGSHPGPCYKILFPGTSLTQNHQLFRNSVEEDAGIVIQPHPNFGTDLTSRVVLQRNKIHNPLYGNKPWECSHPDGATSVLVYPNGGNHVIRYNEFYSTEPNADGSDSGYSGTPAWGHFVQDHVMGGENATLGKVLDDSDVYMNIFMHSMDDAIEVEGSNMNARAWKNYSDYVATGLASTAVSLGPVYFWRNVFNRFRNRYNVAWGPDLNSDRLGSFKAGGGAANFGGGRRYIYHNTALQYPNPNGTACTNADVSGCPLGQDYAINDAELNNVSAGVNNTVSRNNIFDIAKPTARTPINTNGGTNNDFDYDMTNATQGMGVTQTNGRSNSPAIYNIEADGTKHGPLAEWRGLYQLKPDVSGSPHIVGYHDGVPIANFNDLPSGSIDRGAHQSGTARMLFGLAAAGMAAPDLAAASDTGVSTTDNVTNDNTPTFTGSASTGSTVQIFDGTTLLGSVTAANGTYSFTPTTALADGSHSITAKVGAVQSQAITVTIDTQAPASATISAPANGSTISGAVTVTAITDATGVFGVQFKLNNNPLNTEATSSSSSYSTVWDTSTVADGSYSLTATARDAAGNSVTSSTVSVTVINGGFPPPSTPDLDAASDSGTSNTDNITNVTLPKFTGTASAGTTVNIYSDGVQVGSGPITNSAYAITLTTPLAGGTHSITAKATNGTSTSAASTALSIAVDVTAPAVAISSPANAASVSGTVPINATASDASGVAGVQFQLDGTALQAEDTTSPYSINWDTTTLTNGSHTLTAVGRDVAGNIVTSSAVTVTVSNGTNPELNVLVTPQNGTLSTATGEHLDVTVSAGVGLSSVNFYINDVLKGTATAAPFTFSWVTATENPGNYALKVEATSGSGTLTETRPLTLLGTTCEVYASEASVPQGTAVALQGLCSGSKNVAEIQFSVDQITQSSDPSSTYTAIVDTSRLSMGTHDVTATGKFTSPAGESSISRAINVTQPVLSVALLPGAVVLYDEKIKFTASVNDGRQVKQIDFYLDGVFKQGIIAPPYEFTWTSGGIADLGRHTMEVRATDVGGNVVSTTRDILLTPHTCSVELGTSRYRQAGADTVYAGPHQVAQGQRVSLRSECSAWVSINRVEFYLNGVLQTSLPDAPYAWSLDTSGLTVGQTYTVSTKGYLTNGLVSNDAVTVQIIAP